MDPEKRAAVISLFEEMGKKERLAEPERMSDALIGDTTIIGSTIVFCMPEQVAGLLSTLFKKQK